MLCHEYQFLQCPEYTQKIKCNHHVLYKGGEKSSMLKNILKYIE